MREAARGDDSHLFPVHLLVSGSGIKRELQLVGHVMTHLFKGNYSKIDLFALEMSRSRLQKCPILTKQDIKIKAKSCEWMRGFIYLLCERDLNLYLYAIRRFRVRRTNVDSPKLRDHVMLSRDVLSV